MAAIPDFRALCHDHALAYVLASNGVGLAAAYLGVVLAHALWR